MVSAARSPTPARARRSWLIAGATVCLLAIFVWGVHPFLAISRPVDADIMVVEGWVPDYVLQQAAKEFNRGHYARLFISGLFLEKDDPNFHYGSDAARCTQDLKDFGIPAALLEPCPMASPAFNRTSHMARTIRDRMIAMGLRPRGINVVTLGPHARQSYVAYRRMLSALAPVGVIMYPKNDYDTSRWWASKAGVAKTTKDFAGWAKEVLVGLRS